MSERRIVLLGKTGDGKSSCGNTILGEEVFPTGNSPNSETSRCKSAQTSINEKEITVVDVPGFFDTSCPTKELMSEIVRCMLECAPGPHAFVIVLRVGKYTKHERETVKEITDTFGEKVLKHAVVLFTHGDQLSEDQTIEDFVKKNRELQGLVEKCGGRVHVIDSKYWRQQQDGYRSNRVQVEKLLNTIEEMVRENGGQYYSNEMLQKVHAAVEEESKTIIRGRNENALDININITQQAKQRVHTELSVRLVGATVGALLGAFFGCKIAQKALSQAEMGPNITTVVLVTAAVVGGVVGGVIGYEAVEGAESMSEAMQSSVGTVFNSLDGMYENITCHFKLYEKNDIFKKML